MSEPHYKLSAAGKLFFASLISWLTTGSKSPVKLKATPEQVEALKKVVVASKEFQEEVNNPMASIESVIDKMRKKNLAVAEFNQVTKRSYPL